jgi:deoxyadenosine/deoxycytidine kinase
MYSIPKKTLVTSTRSLISTKQCDPKIIKSNVLHPVLISIEGNIGSGKSTLLKNLRLRNPEWSFIDEPVDTWSNIRNDEGNSMLEVFYKDRKRWSYTFQNCALLTRHQYIEAAVKNMRTSVTGNHVFLTERCLDTDFHVFTKMLRAEGSIDKLELDLYLRLLTQLKSTATPLSAIIHVNTPPLVCAERIKMRSRSGEDSISMDYLTALDQRQTEWIASETLPTLVTDVSDITHAEDFIRSLMDREEGER